MAEATSNEACDGSLELTEQDLVDYLCTAVEEEDALYVWIWLRRLKERGAKDVVTSLHSWKQRSALSFAANAPQTPVRLFILQMLLLSSELGDALPSSVKDVGALPWAEEEARRIEPEREAEAPEATAFLALKTEHEAADWVDKHLPPLDKDPDELTGYKPLPPQPPCLFPPQLPSLAANADIHPSSVLMGRLPTPLPSSPQALCPSPPRQIPTGLVLPELVPTYEPPSFLPLKPTFDPWSQPDVAPFHAGVSTAHPPRKVLFTADHPIGPHLFPVTSTETAFSLGTLFDSLDPPIENVSDIRFKDLISTTSSLRRVFLTVPSRAIADRVVLGLDGKSYRGKTVRVARQLPLVRSGEEWKFPFVSVEGLSFPSATRAQQFEDLVRSLGLGGVASTMCDEVQSRGTFRVSSPDAAQRAVELLNGLEQVGGGVVKAKWGMDEGVEWEVVG